MTENLISASEIKEIDNYLKGYALNMKLLRLDRYERTYFGYRDGEDSPFNDAPLARARMFEIRHFILSLPNSTEKILLYLHYINCEPIERCASIMNLSRSSAFRLKNRAIELACEKNRA